MKLMKNDRVQQFREARRFVALFPDAYRIKYHFLGPNREWWAWTLEEKVTGFTFQQGLFLEDFNQGKITTTYGHRCSGKTTDWTIREFSSRAWRYLTHLRFA